MKILVVEPRYAPYETDVSTIKEVDDIVGGRLSVFYPFADKNVVVGYSLTAMANKTSKSFNRCLHATENHACIYGTFIVLGMDELEFVSLTPDQVADYKAELWKAEKVVGHMRNGLVLVEQIPPAIKNTAKEVDPKGQNIRKE